jgi:hypothetical protein
MLFAFFIINREVQSNPRKAEQLYSIDLQAEDCFVSRNDQVDAHNSNH